MSGSVGFTLRVDRGKSHFKPTVRTSDIRVQLCCVACNVVCASSGGAGRPDVSGTVVVAPTRREPSDCLFNAVCTSGGRRRFVFCLVVSKTQMTSFTMLSVARRNRRERRAADCAGRGEGCLRQHRR